MTSPAPEEVADAPPSSEGRTTAREFGGHFLWVGSGRIASEAIRLGGTLLLTRLLNQEMFGLVLVVNRLIQGLNMVTDVGINASIVQNKAGAEPRFLNTAWSVQILRGVLLWAVSWALASTAAGFYDEPALGDLVPVAGLSLLIAGFNSPALALVRRHLHVRTWVLIDVGAQLASVVAMIVTALLTRSVWALIVGAIVAAVVRLGVSHAVKVGPRPRLGWDKTAFHALVTFGVWIIVNTFVGWLADSADALAMPRIVPMAVVGVYGVASQLGSIPYRFLVAVGSNAVFPLFSRTCNQAKPLVPVYQMVQRGVLTVGGVAIACLVALGEPTIELLLDDRWRAAGAMLWPIAVSQWFRIMAIPGANAVFALGHPNWLVIGNTTKVLGYVAFVPLGVYIGQLNGSAIHGALWGFAAGESLSVITYRVAMARFKQPVGFQEAGPLGRLILSMVSMAALSHYVDPLAFPALIRAALSMLLVAVIWYSPLKKTLSEAVSLRRGPAAP